MSLPENWTNKIFQKLILAYGRDFTGRYEGVPLEEVKADWAHELSGYQQSPNSIAYALCNLPDKPPNVFQFRAICRAAPSEAVPALEYDYGPTTPEGRAAGAKLAREVLARIRSNPA